MWWTAPSRLHGLPAVQLISGRPAGFAVAALIVIAAVLVIAVRPLRSRRLAALAAVSLLVSLAVLVTYSRIPVIRPNLITLDYLDIIMFPVGVLGWLVVGSAVVLAGRRLISRRPPQPQTAAVPGTAAAPQTAAAPETPAAVPRAGRAARAVTRAVAVAAVVLIALLSWLAVSRQGPVADARLAGLISIASRQIERALPRQPVDLVIRDRQVGDQKRLVLGLVWMLRVSGYRPEVRHANARELGPQYVFRDEPIPQVTLRVRGGDVSVHVAHPGPRQRMPLALSGVRT